jgi:hypothetical protein
LLVTPYSGQGQRGNKRQQYPHGSVHHILINDLPLSDMVGQIVFVNIRFRKDSSGHGMAGASRAVPVAGNKRVPFRQVFALE